MARPKKNPALPPTVAPAFQRELEQGVVYTMTEDLALIFAKLLTIGCPPLRAVLYVHPQLNENDEGRTAAKKVAWQWQNDALVLEAINSINGGQFHELPAEKRYRLALEKSNAEAAFYLWSTNFVNIDHREGIDKIKIARDILKSELGQQPDEADPMAAFARFAMELSKNMHTEAVAKSKKPPQQQPSGFDKLLETVTPEHKM